MTVTREGDLTLINTFVVKPGKADELLALLVEATEKTMRHRPGFVSANFLRSLDGTRVINYGQLRSTEDFDALKDDPEARRHMDAATRLVEKFEPVIYRVHSVHGRRAG